MTDKIKNDIIQWDIKSWNRALQYWERNIEWNKINNALELGGRKGGLSLWLALKNKQVICSDLKDVKATAGDLHKRYKVSELIQYRDIDATDIPYENFFDIVVFKSIIGGIGRGNNIEIQQKVFREIYKALKTGGKLLFAENLIASPLHQQLRKKFLNWGGSWRYVSINEMREFLKEFSTISMQTTGVLGTFGRTEGQRSILATVDNVIMNRLCPDSCKYIVYGIATK